MKAIVGYEPIRLLYAGVYTNTYAARNHATGTHVWLKTAAAAHPSASDLERLRHECDISSALAEAGFPVFRNLRRYGDTLACVADNVGENGVTVREWMDALRGPDSLIAILSVALRLVGLLDAFHRRRLVHHQIAPDTLWIEPETWNVRPIDYGFARETGADPESVFATLADIRHFAYLSPELTGRLHRPVDDRSDFYALGAMLYEMTTGRWPIRADDPVQWLHALVTRDIMPPQQRDPRIPTAVGNLIMKCLSKSPDDRYQSLYALRNDLEQCLELARSDRWETPIVPADRDIPSHFRISERLVGRERELAELDVLLNRPDGRCGLALVSGEPGVGKTALLREWRRRWTNGKRIVLGGKFDQVHRNTPFRAWVDAFREFVRFVLVQSEEEVASWKREIDDLVGAGAIVLNQLVPHMENIIGPRPPVDKLVGVELLHRFEAVMIRFLHVFAKKGLPVTFVLDDMQWADPASARLLVTVLGRDDLTHVRLIGAFRDHAEERGRLWDDTLRQLEAFGDRVGHIRLEPMRAAEIAQWLADTLHCEPAAVSAWADRLEERTGGNPLFLQEYLRTLHAEQRVRYDADAGRWVWDQREAEAEAAAAYAHVGDLLLARLRGVSPGGMRLLRYAACASGAFSMKTIDRLLENDAVPAADAAEELVRLGLIVPNGTDGYVFSHDRVRLTVYSLMPESEQAQIHGRWGKFLLEEGDPAGSDRIFDIVHHLTLGNAQLADTDRQQLAGLHLLAGQRARDTAAFDEAALFFRRGGEWLPEDAWQTEYRLTYELTLGHLECAYLAGDDAEAEQLFQELDRRAATVEDRTRAYLTKIKLDSRTDKYERAIRLGLKALSALGVSIPEHPSRLRLLLGWLMLKRHAAEGSLQRLERLGPANDRRSQDVMELIFALGASTYVRNPDLMVYLALRSCRLTFASGIFPNSGIGLVAYGAANAFLAGDIAGGLQWGDTAWRLTERFGTLADKYYTAFMYGAFLHHWGHPLAESEEFLEKSIAFSIESGNLEFLGYSATHLIVMRHVRGVPLEQLAEEVERNERWSGRLKDPHFHDFLRLYKHFIRNLQGKTESVYRFDDGPFREADYEQGLSDERKRFDYLLCKIQALYLLGRIEEAAALARDAQRMIDAFVGIVNVPELDFYFCLIVLASVGSVSKRERRETWRLLRKKRRRFRAWANTCPSHYEHKLKLIEAEMARVAGKDGEAAVLYQQAIDAAGEHAYLQNEAIALECAARFYRERNRQRAFERHLSAAFRGFLAWGAHAKAGLLLREHPWLADETEQNEAAAGAVRYRRALADSLDVSAVVRASQAISMEIVPDQLLRQLLTIVLHHSGADRIVLLLERSGTMAVAASGIAADNGMNCRLLEWTPVSECADLAAPVVDYVLRTGETLVLDAAHADPRFGGDRHLAGRNVESLLCMPIRQRGEMSGLMYLENGKTGGVFTPHRVEVLELLSSQIAISIQNAMLYDRLRTENSELEGAYAQTAMTLEHKQREAAGALIEKAISEERSRIAGDIHDTIGHTLTSVLLQIEAGIKLIGKQDVGTALTKLDNSQQQLREGLQQLRKSLFMLKEGTGDSEDFVPVLESFIQKTMEYTGIRIDSDILADIRLTAPQKYVLYRALQEGITNGIRHGKATRFTFSLSRDDRWIVFTLCDDGQGNDDITYGFGLTAMNGRVRELNGSMRIRSERGYGCTLHIRLPVAELS